MTWDIEDLEDAEAVINSVVRRFKRKYWWADVEDLSQEAWLAVVKAMPKWDKRVGVALEGYLWKTAEFALRPYIWSSSSILSAPHGKKAQLLGTQREDEAVLETIISKQQSVEAGLAEARWSREVRARLSRVFSSFEDGKFAEAVMMVEVAPAIVADAFRVPIARVYRANSRARRALEMDYKLLKLWRTGP